MLFGLFSLIRLIRNPSQILFGSMGLNGLYGTVFSTFLEVELVSDRCTYTGKRKFDFSSGKDIIAMATACRRGGPSDEEVK